MPGEPVEVLIGVTGLGFGILLVYSAYKDVSPLTIIKDTISNGTFPDISKLPHLFGKNTLIGPSLTARSWSSDLEQKDPALYAKVQAAIDKWTKSPSQANLAAIHALIATMRAKGYTAEAADLESVLATWVAEAANPPPQVPAGTLQPVTYNSTTGAMQA